MCVINQIIVSKEEKWIPIIVLLYSLSLVLKFDFENIILTYLPSTHKPNILILQLPESQFKQCSNDDTF